MNTLTAARAQMEVSLAFHIVFAALGIGVPLLMVIAEGLGLRTGQAHYTALTRKWAKATALTFAVGAVSGTALSFELGLLWPRFMAVAGGIFGPAFALEGFAFFVEAIFIGLYLYGWDRLSPRAHWLTGWPIVLSGAASAVLVVAANAWMQTPAPFRMEGGRVVAAALPFASASWMDMAVHAVISSYLATAAIVAGVYAVGLLRGRRDAYHRSGLAMALGLGLIAAVAQPISGDFTARRVARTQPAKLAAAEALFHTQRRAPLLIGGIPDARRGETRFALAIPGGLSLLAKHDIDAQVMGLDAFPPQDRPNVLVTHLSFDIMVGSGLLLLAVAALYWLVRWRRRRKGRGGLPGWLLGAIAVTSPLGLLAVEAGWFVTEVGRQPWVIYGYMRTADGVTPVPQVPYTFVGFTLLYLFLGTALVVLLRRLAASDVAPAPKAREVTHAS